MRNWILLFVLLFAVFAAADEKAVPVRIFGSNGMKAGTPLQELEQESGLWLPAPYPCRTAKGGGISTVWKGHRSVFRFKMPQPGSWRLELLVRPARDAGGEVTVVPQAGDTALPGIAIGADGTLAGFDGKTAKRLVYSDRFRMAAGEWTPVWIEFHSGEKSAYSVGSGKTTLLEKIPLAAGTPQFIDRVELRACTSGDGGREIQLDQFKLIPVAGPLPIPTIRLEPENGKLGGCFVFGNPVIFLIGLSGFVPNSGIEASWTLSPYYRPETVLATGRVELDNAGNAKLQMPDLLKKQGYRLRIALSRQGKEVVWREYTFAILSPPPEPAADVDREWLGMATLEMHPSSPGFERDLAIFNLLGVRHIRIWSPWSWYHSSSDRPPALEEKIKAAERFEQDGIHWIEDIQAAPEWASDAPSDGVNRWKYPPKDWKYYKTYIDALTSALGDRASYQIWCEPSSWMAIDRIESKYPGGVAEVIARYMKLTEEAVKKNAPKSIFMGPASSSGVPEWTSILLRRYGTHFNAISYHYPKWPNTPRSTNQRIQRDILRYADRRLPQYCDEADSFAFRSPKGKNQQLVTLQIAVEQWAEGICRRFYHCVFRHPRVHDDPSNCYLSADFQASDGIVVFQTLLERTRNADYIGKREFPDGALLHFYRKGGKLCAVGWCNGEAIPLPSNLLSSGTRLIDRYGNELDRKGLKLDGAPVYFENISLEALGEKPFLQLRPERFRLDDGLSQPVRLTLYNPSAKTVSGKVRFADEFAEVTPVEQRVELQPGECRELELMIRPRKGCCDFHLRPIIAEWNGGKIAVGRAQYFNNAELKVVDAGEFTKNPEVWDSASKGFDHADLSKSTAAETGAGFRTVCRDGGAVSGEFRARFAPKPEAGWLGLFFPRKPLELPGIPVAMRMKLRATTEMMPSSVGVLFRFEDARGKIVQYGLNPFLSPSNNPGEIVMESGLDSPVSQAHRHSQWGGGDPKSISYPIRFLGFSLNPTPQRVRDAEWNGRIEVKSIEFDCYTPQDPVVPVPQLQDNTVQF